MKEILFIFNPGCYPVPAINGGAVEALVTTLIEENEIQQKFNFHIIMCKNENDTTNYDYSNYKHTKFYDFYQNDFAFKKDRIVNGVNKRLNYSLPLYSKYEKFILKTINDVNPEFIIFEGSFNSIVRKLKNQKNKLALHVHHQIMPKHKIDKFFGHMICVSEFIKKDWQDSKVLIDNFKYHVLPNCLTSTTFFNTITDEELNELRKKFNLSKDDYVVIFCGRLVEIKGIDILIKSINSLKNDNIKLMIVGESAFKNSNVTPFVNHLKNLVEENKKNIFFTGYIDNHDLYKYYSIANLQVIPSVCEEASPLTGLEGRAMKLPQLITNSGGLPENASKKAILLDKSNNLEKMLAKEIKNFYDGKYDHVSFKDEKAPTGQDYYDWFTELTKTVDEING